MRKLIVLITLLTVGSFMGISEAVPTKIVVRAKSKDAKFIGTKMGGALVVITDSETGKVLAEGLTSGGTGDTGVIVQKPHTRFGRIAQGAAGFDAEIDISEPRLITIEVSAPYKDKDNMVKSSTQMWLIPGKDVTGEGIILEVPGFSVDARSPETAKLDNGKAVIQVRAEIVMI